MHRPTTLLAIFIFALIARAQSWDVADFRQYDDETIVYASLNYNATDPADSWIVGAFIDGICHGEADTPATGPDGSRFFVIRVHGNHDADMGKPITFRVRHKATGQRFYCQSSRPVTFTGESEGTPSSPIMLSFEKKDPVELQGFQVAIGTLVAGQEAEMVLMPIPADADFDAGELDVQFTGSLPRAEEWNRVHLEQQPSSGDYQSVVYRLTPAVPQEYTLTVGQLPLYDAATGQPLARQEVGAPLNLHDGWQWRTNYYGSLDATNMSATFGGDALTEIRTQYDLLYNDPEWGYFGTLMESGLQQNTAYKVRMQTDLSSSLWKGRPVDGYTITLEEGYTWMPSPYYFDRLLSTAIDAASLASGMIIIAKEAGSAEWDGTQWVGDLRLLPAGESFIIYNPSDTRQLVFRSEADMLPRHDATAAPPAEASPARTVGGNATAASLFGFQPTVAHRFMDNLTLVARLHDLPLAEHLAVGAFVGNECRGISHTASGYLFLTIHCQRGEHITLRLVNLATGSLFDISETLSASQPHIGSLRVPIILHAPEAVTGISHSSAATANSSPTRYDLGGRRLANGLPRRGIVIERQADGTTRRIIR